MYTRYYDGYPAQIQTESEKDDIKQPAQEEAVKCDDTPPVKVSSVAQNRFGGLKSEDVLLVALLMITITESKDDFILPLILGALLLE